MHGKIFSLCTASSLSNTSKNLQSAMHPLLLAVWKAMQMALRYESSVEGNADASRELMEILFPSKKDIPAMVSRN